MTTPLSDRRAFLGAALSTVAATSLFRTMNGAAPWFQISLAQWSLHRALFKGDLKPLEFARHARERYGIDAVEYVNSFYKKDVATPGFVAEWKQRAEDAGVRSLLIMIDGEGAIGDPDDKKRAQAIANHKPWLDAAKALGCHAIRVNAESRGSYEEQMKLAADGLGRLARIAEPLGLHVLVENHGGLSSNGAWLAGVMKLAAHPRCGTLPDFGNFHIGDGKWYDRYQGMAELMPFAKAVSAKSHEFNAEGIEVRTDYARVLKIVRDAGYRGHIGIEYEGDKHSEEEGIRRTKDLLTRLRESLQAG